MSQLNRKKFLSTLPKNAGKAQKELAKSFLDGISDEDLGLFSEGMAQRMIARQWDLTQKRKKGQPAISIVCEEKRDESGHKTIVDVVHDDMAFLIDSVVAKINYSDLLIDFLLHPIVGVQRDKAGKITAVTNKSDKKSDRVSHMHIHIKQGLTAKEMKALDCLLYTSPSPRDRQKSRMPSSA